jgi:hypothetical protein
MADIVGCSDQFIRDLIDDQTILAHQSRPPGRAARAQRRHSYRIHREAVLMYLLESANYTPRDLLERIAEIARSRLSPNQQKRLGKWLCELSR